MFLLCYLYVVCVCEVLGFFQMRVHLLSNSLAADVDRSLFDGVKIIPGASYEPLLEEVVRYPGRYTKSLVYFLIGPLLHSRRHRTSTRTETVLRSHPDNTSDIFLGRFRQRLADIECTPVVCTTFPMDFARYNECSGRGPRIMRAFYKEYTDEIIARVVEDNKMIVALNTINHVHTPFMGKKIFPRVGARQCYSFRRGSLRDGLHPDSRTVRDWERELRRNIALNEERTYYRRRQAGSGLRCQ